MVVHRLRAAPLLLTFALAAVVSCDGDTPPTGPSNGSTATPPAVSVMSLELLGAPEAIAPGSVLQLRANAVRSDGSREDVTERASWSTSNPASLQVSPAGMVTAAARGEGTVAAGFEGRSANAAIIVVSPGTFRLAGQITELGVPVDGVTLQVLAGTGEGLTAVTSASGAYALYGVAGSIRLHGKKHGYENIVRDIHVANHARLDVEMAPGGAQPNLNGTYELTITASGCSALPAAAQRRTYQAVLTQRAERLTVRLSGADFIVANGHGDSFTGWSQLGRISFSLGSDGLPSYGYYYYYPFTPPQIVERWTGGSALHVTGSVHAMVEGNDITGALDGKISLTNVTVPPFWPETASCYSRTHRFELRRR